MDVKNAHVWAFFCAIVPPASEEIDEKARTISTIARSVFERKPAPDAIRGGCRFALRKRVKTKK
jgi:hypothetical protein